MHPTSSPSPRTGRRIGRVAGTVLVAFVLTASFIPSGAAQGTQKDFWNSGERTFFLHLAQYCDRDASLIRWIDEFDWPNDLDGCGGNVLDPTEGGEWTDTYPSFNPLHANITPATTATMHIFILSRAVDQTTVEGTIDVGYAACVGSDGPEVLVQERVGGYHEFIVPCEFELTGEPDSRAQPNLTITVSATYTYGYGTEDDHASYVTISGVEPVPPTEEVEFFEASQRPQVEFEEDELQFADLPEDAGEESPGVGVVATLALLAVVLSAVSRHRRS